MFKNVLAARGLIVSHCSLYHMTQIIQLMAEIFLQRPPLVTSPLVGMLGIHRARSVQIAVGFTDGSHDIQHTVYIMCQFGIWICQQKIASALYGLIYIRVIEGITLEYIHITGMSRPLKILVAPSLSHLLKANGIVTLRLASRRWPQKLSVTFTDVNGTGVIG